ncbi:hypothetical protein [Dapis sp. BLCC M229]|uniref:hypothetical protein n=1 Tax=Dapis sp. BLCC M229 TaxID=3400188 RepID=UPI003CF75F18
MAVTLKYVYLSYGAISVGWVEERNPTTIGFCWVSLRSTQPTFLGLSCQLL